MRSVHTLKKTFVNSIGALGLVAAALMLSACSEEKATIVNDNKPDLYEISDNDSSIFIYVSIHLLTPDVEWEKDILKEQIANADRVFFELDMDDPNMALAAQQEMMSRATRNGEPVSTQLSPEEFEKLTGIMAGMGLSAQALDQFDPWFHFLIGSQVIMAQQGFNPQLGVESVLTGYAATAGKDIEGLETLALQLDVFETTPQEEQVLLLKEMLASTDELSETIDTMITLWKADEGQKLAELMGRDMAKTPEISKKLLEDRNYAWIETFKTLLKDNDTSFIAVGAGHLYGEDGVLALLEKEGYKISRQ